MSDAAIKLVLMARDAEQFPAPHTAEVHPDEVENYKAADWKVSAASAAPPVVATEEITAIPDDWQDKHWKQRVALAKELGWVDGEPSAEQANGWISDVIEHRRREEPQEALGGLSIREAHDKLTRAGLEWEAGATVEDLAAMLDTVA